MTPQFYWGGPEMLGRALRARRDWAARGEVAGDIGAVGKYMLGQRSQDQDIKDEEYALQQRLATQQVDAQDDTKHPQSTDPGQAQEEYIKPTTAGEEERTATRKGLLAQLAGTAGDFGTALRNMLLGDPQRGQRFRHILQMQAQLEGQKDIEERVKTVAGAVPKGSPDYSESIAGAGGRKLGIKPFRPAPQRFARGADIKWQAATDRAREKTGMQDPPSAAILQEYDTITEDEVKRQSNIRADVTAAHRPPPKAAKGAAQHYSWKVSVDPRTGERLSDREAMHRRYIKSDPNYGQVMDITQSGPNPPWGGSGEGGGGAPGGQRRWDETMEDPTQPPDNMSVGRAVPSGDAVDTGRGGVDYDPRSGAVPDYANTKSPNYDPGTQYGPRVRFHEDD